MFPNEPEKHTYLTWISDADLQNAVVKFYSSFRKSAHKRSTLKGLQKHLVDPFIFVFDAAFSETNVDVWLKHEVGRQVQKSLANAIGKFHQSVLGSCADWEDLDKVSKKKEERKGADVRKKDLTVWAQVKNKHNTVKKSDQKDTVFKKLQALANEDENRTCYSVEILTHKPLDEVWVIDGESHPRVKVISGEKFYALVTGNENALKELYDVLPQVIKDVKAKVGDAVPLDASAVISELKGKLGIDDLSLTSAFPRTAEYFYASVFERTTEPEEAAKQLSFLAEGGGDDEAFDEDENDEEDDTEYEDDINADMDDEGIPL